MVAAAVVGFLALHVSVAKADGVTHTFTGVDAFAGTDFNYDTSNFLSFPSEVAPTTQTELYEDGGEEQGTITEIDFINETELELLYSSDGETNGMDLDDGTSTYQIDGAGTYTIRNSDFGDVGELKITETAVTPEPGTGILWITGIGLGSVMRKRLGQLLRPDTGVHRSLSPH
jgi:hypothetical protein